MKQPPGWAAVGAHVVDDVRYEMMMMMVPAAAIVTPTLNSGRGLCATLCIDGG